MTGRDVYAPNGVHTADHAVPPLDTDTVDLFDDLAGIHPGIDQILSGLRLIAVDRHSVDTVPTLLAALAGGTHGNPDILRALTTVLVRLGDPATNPALRALTPRRAQQVRAHTRQWDHYDTDFAPRALLAEAAGWADPHCPEPDHPQT